MISIFAENKFIHSIKQHSKFVCKITPTFLLHLPPSKNE